MADRVSAMKRSEIMRAVRSRDTTPEMRVRRAAHRMRLRFRLHRKTLPGTPDLVFPKRKIAVFVHGCFWHRHINCSKASTPTSAIEFWAAKFESNVARDRRVRRRLRRLGWKVVTVWQCEVTTDSAAENVLRKRIISLFEE